MGVDPLVLFVFAGLFSPGPNVILLTASGARFGLTATLPHMAGVALGVGFVAAATALGLGAALLAVPGLAPVLRLVALGWIGWMAWGLWRRAGRSGNTAPGGGVGTPTGGHAGGRTAGADRPFTFVEAVAFQWINPKLWAVALGAGAAFPAGLSPLAEALRMGLVFSATNAFVVIFWTTAGHAASRLLSTPGRWRAFDRGMALLLAASGLMVLV